MSVIFYLAFDLDVVKLTAQFVARNGRHFLTNLMNREQRNYQVSLFVSEINHDDATPLESICTVCAYLFMQ
jgi:hypothetical protein